MGRSSGAYLARPRAELGGTVAAGARAAPVDATAARENDMEGRLESSRREMRPGDLTRRPARSWNPGDPTARLSDDPTVFEASVSALGGLGSALLRLCAPSTVRSFAAVNLGYPKTHFKNQKIPFARAKNHQTAIFLRLGRIQFGQSVQIILTVNPHRDQWRLGVDAGMEIGRPMASLERAFSASAVASDDTIE